MENNEQIKRLVRDKYDRIARSEAEMLSCCGSSSCCEDVTVIMSDDYTRLEGYQAEADLGLGCGLPTEFARIRPGDTVIDLGSGAGNDCFIARHEAGPEGHIIGIDFSESMIARARGNAAKLGFTNVEFRHGDLEAMPVADSTADVIVSNCVLNLVPDKPKVFGEIFRVLKPGAHFSISDVVVRGTLPDALREDAELYAGCVAGAIPKKEYLEIVRESGFQNITVQKEKRIDLPDDLLRQYLDETQLQAYHDGSAGLFSITAYAEKPR